MLTFKKKKKHVLIFIFQILDWLTDFIVVYVRSSSFILVVAIFLLHGLPLIYVYSFCSTWIASIYVCTYNTWLFSLESISPFCVLEIFVLTWITISLLIWSYQQYQFIKYCQKIVKKIRDTSPAINIAFSSNRFQCQTLLSLQVKEYWFNW